MSRRRDRVGRGAKRLAGALLIVAGLAAPAAAALKGGDVAPDFTLEAAVGGKDFTFSLSNALKKGPVVLYFYPKSFTRGCAIEAHEFAEAAESFAQAGASLIGVSKDTIETQRKFSTEECRDKFPVGADPDLSVIRSYDAQRIPPTAAGDIVSDRISYVIGPDQKVLFAYADSSPEKHVETTLAAVRKWRETHQ